MEQYTGGGFWSALAGLFGGGVVVKLYDLYKRHQTGDHDFLIKQYKDLIEYEKRRNARLGTKVDGLESQISTLKIQMTEVVAETIRLKGELECCLQNQERDQGLTGLPMLPRLHPGQDASDSGSL